MRKIFIIISFFIINFLSAQVKNAQIDSIYKPDIYYLEDQIYFGISYVALVDLPENIKQNGFSNAIKFGYIRDIPINKRRNIGFGLGVGYGRDEYFQNLRISTDESSAEPVYEILGTGYKSNSLILNKVEIPFEIRVRGSNPEKFAFWRLYAGVTFAYVYASTSEYYSNKIHVQYKDLKLINPWQYGVSLSLGYGKWNFNYYYGISDIIKNGIEVSGKSVKMKEQRFGIIFYFL